MSKTYKIDEMDFVRAGSDFLGFAWSCHVAGQAFKMGEKYIFEREDGTTYPVWAVGRETLDGKRCWHLVDEDGAMMMGF